MQESRSQRVERLTRAVRSGSYRVDPERLAGAILLKRGLDEDGGEEE